MAQSTSENNQNTIVAPPSPLPIINENTQRSREHLRSWIRTEQLLQHVNDNVIDKCVQSALDLFTSNKELLHFVVKHTSQQRLDIIYDTLKQEHEQEKKLMQKKSNTVNSTKLKAASSNFDKISKESISNICGFLNRCDIQLFKQTSRTISIICLEEMGKYSIGICTAFQMMKTNVNNIKDMEWYKYMSYNRYNNITKYNLLFEKIEIRHCIPIKYQIPITIDLFSYIFKFVGNKYNNIKANKSLIMFDKRDITILHGDTHWNMDENDVFDPDTDTLITLHEFNINTQQIENVKCIIIDRSIDIQMLKNYIFALTQKKQPITLYNITYLMSGDDDCDIIDTDELLNNMSSAFLPIIFQTDTNSDDWSKVQNKYLIENLKFCHLEFDEYIYYLTKMKEQEREMTIDIHYAGDINILKPEIKTKITMFKDGLKVNIDLNVQIIRIKQYIAKQLDDIIGYKNIELFKKSQFDRKDHEILKNSNRLHEYECNTEILFEIVPYKTTEERYIDKRVFRCKVYSSQQALFPYNCNIAQSLPTTITLKLNQDCTVNEYVNELIKNASNPLVQYQHLQQSLDNYVSAPHPMCYAITSKYRDKHRIVQIPKNTIEISHNDFDKVKELILYMIPNEMKNKSRTNRLVVRFAWESEVNTNMNQNTIHDKLIGLPLIIWVDENDTLEYVINNKIIQQYNDHILEIYKVKSRSESWYDKMVLIPQNKRDSYKISENILKNDPDGFIVITLKTNNAINMDQFHHVYFHCFI